MLHHKTSQYVYFKNVSLLNISMESNTGILNYTLLLPYCMQTFTQASVITIPSKNIILASVYATIIISGRFWRRAKYIYSYFWYFILPSYFKSCSFTPRILNMSILHLSTSIKITYNFLFTENVTISNYLNVILNLGKRRAR